MFDYHDDRIWSVLVLNQISVHEAEQWLLHFDPELIETSSLSSERWLEIEKVFDREKISAEELSG